MVFTYSQFSFILLPSFTGVNGKILFNRQTQLTQERKKKTEIDLMLKSKKIEDHQDENRSTLERWNVETTTNKKNSEMSGFYYENQISFLIVYRIIHQ